MASPLLLFPLLFGFPTPVSSLSSFLLPLPRNAAGLSPFMETVGLD